MERRFLLAVSLMIAVLVVPSFFLKRPPARRPAAADSAQAAQAARTPGAPATPAPQIAPAAPRPGTPAPAATVPASSGAAVYDTALVTQPSAAYRFSTAGATLDRAVFPNFKSFHDREHREPVQLVRPGDRLLAHRIVAGSDTLKLDSIPFTAA